MTEIGRGPRTFAAEPARGAWTRLDTPEEVIALLDDDAASGIVAVVRDAGATFLAPIFEDLAAVVCTSGTPQSHIGIVSRECRVPCVMGAELATEPEPGTTVEVDCTQALGTVRLVG